MAFIGPLAMVLVTDPQRGSSPGEDGLRAMFDLTPAEAKLVVALCGGETLATYADTTGTSLNTAKTHLKRVFEKTGETRQADLIRRSRTMWSCVADRADAMTSKRVNRKTGKTRQADLVRRISAEIASSFVSQATRGRSFAPARAVDAGRNRDTVRLKAAGYAADAYP